MFIRFVFTISDEFLMVFFFFFPQAKLTFVPDIFVWVQSKGLTFKTFKQVEKFSSL
jgi:hypothetical protein